MNFQRCRETKLHDNTKPENKKLFKDHKQDEHVEAFREVGNEIARSGKKQQGTDTKVDNQLDAET